MLVQNSELNRNSRHGAMLPMLAVVMLILLVCICIGVDIARMHLTRSELRLANDAAARAAVEAIGRTQNQTSAEDAAILIAGMNQVAGTGLTLNRNQVEIGHAVKQSSGAYTFAPGGSFLTSARVSGERTPTAPDGDVGLLFGPLFGVDSFCANSISTAMQSQRDIALVLDVSGSMDGDKFTDLGNALDSFLAVLNTTPYTEHVSLTVYESTSRKLQPMTPTLSLISAAFADEEADGSTAIGLGLADGLDSLNNDANARPNALKAIVVMTDGVHNAGIDPETIADQCAAQNVAVYTITFGSGADQTRMQTVAARGNGTHTHAANAAELDAAFIDIARQLSVMLIE